MKYNNTELYHYGVLGMRWGIRKAKKYSNKSKKLKRKGNYSKAAKYAAKSMALTKKHTTRAGGAKAVSYTTSESLYKTISKTYLMGTYGTLKYNEARAKGTSRGAAYVNALPDIAVNALTGGLYSIIEPRVRS